MQYVEEMDTSGECQNPYTSSLFVKLLLQICWFGGLVSLQKWCENQPNVQCKGDIFF